MKEKSEYNPVFVCFIEKEEDGYSAIIGLTGIPNRKYANWTLDRMKRAMDDMMARTLGEIEMDKIRAKRKVEAKTTKKDEGVKH